MGKINLLDISVANLIAAGEVVDRPASVVKELMENAIDARASEITVEIKNGGIALIRVSDNGCGMERDDASLCLRRHATSKIAAAEDLDGIITLGFRGEALAAIASVSSLRIITKRKKDPAGTLVKASCGAILEVSDVGCRDGTTVIVEELFHNVPARRKFLKRDVSEAMAVAAVVEKIALSRPDIAIRFISDNQEKMNTAGDGKLQNAIYAVLGRDFAKRLLRVHDLSGGVEVDGYIGCPDNVRANRNYQNFFINGRYIKSKTASAALEQAFSSYLETERFPCCVLSIRIHPSAVDVNVHPTKLEVKFSNERTVFDAVYAAVRSALQKGMAHPEIDLARRSRRESFVTPFPIYDSENRKDGRGERISLAGTAESPAFSPSNQVLHDNPGTNGEEKDSFDRGVFRTSAGDTAVYTEREKTAASGTLPPEMSRVDSPPLRQDPPASPPSPSPYEGWSVPSPLEGNGRPSAFSADPPSAADVPPRLTDAVPIPPEGTAFASSDPSVTRSGEDPALSLARPNEEFRILGVAFSLYILVEVGQKLLMIDKHAAHERILFEKMKENMRSKEKFNQSLLVPLEIPLSPEERSAAELHKKEIQEIGFAYTLKEDEAVITEHPGCLSADMSVDLFIEIVGRLAGGTGDASHSGEIAFEKALYQASCKAAIKGGQKEDEGHLRYIVKQVLSIPNLRYCPHGRPVAFEISKGSIEHQFKRS